MKYKVKDYIGQKFGYLTLVSDEPHPDKSNRTTYLCRCDCGGTRYVRLHMLVEGAALTCSRMCKFHGNNHTRAKPVIAKDEQGNVIARYNTITEVARLHGKETATANYWIKHGMSVKGIRYFFDE